MKNTGQQPQSKFKYFVWTITALGHLTQRRRYHNWSEATVCREAVSALHIYLLEVEEFCDCCSVSFPDKPKVSPQSPLAFAFFSFVSGVEHGQAQAADSETE